MLLSTPIFPRLGASAVALPAVTVEVTLLDEPV